eukprot:3266536-Prymnesium_polylepis.1
MLIRQEWAAQIRQVVVRRVHQVYEAAVQKDTTHANTALAKRYRRLVMQLLYCSMMTRPDIALAVGLLTR